MANLAPQSTLSPQRQPFVYIAAAFAIGIILERWAGPALWPVFLLTVLLTGAAAGFVFKERPVAASALLLAGLMMAGVLASAVERRSIAPNRLIQLYDSQKISPDDPVELVGLLAQPPEPIPDGRLLDIAAERVTSKQQELNASGKARLMISLADDDLRAEFAPLALEYGSRVRILVRLARAQTFGNPGSIDFNEFLERRGYDLKGTIKSPLLIERLGRARINPVLDALYRLRLGVMSALDAHFEPKVAGTLKAMLVGNRYFLDQTTVRRLREGGTFHTLVIAGLHVGIIAWLLLGGRSVTRRRHSVRIVFALGVLWGYAVMVGMAPPVTRTTLMITIGVIGPLLFRRSISMNSVALAGFVMLAIDPASIADAGFQLSFVAVGGIVTLAIPLSERLREIGQWRPTSESPHPPRCSKAVKALSEILFWSERNFQRESQHSQVVYKLDKSTMAKAVDRYRIQPVIQYASLLAITSAVIQIATLPLMVFYFNRVSPIGVVTNIVAGLLTGLLMIGSALTIAVGALSSGLASILARCVTGFHFLLVNSIAPFSHIPGATFRSAQYDGPAAIVYFVYFVPLVLFVYWLDRWRPVDRVLQVIRSGGDKRDIPIPVSARRDADVVVRGKGRVRNLITGFTSNAIRRTIATVAAGVLFACILAIMRPVSSVPKGLLTIDFLDVGQGDSALVIFPHGSTMLIDGGGELHINRRPRAGKLAPQARPDRGVAPEDDPDTEHDFNDTGFSIGEAVVSRFLWSLGLNHLDYVLASHAHEDHTGGLSDVLEDFPVGELIVGHAPPSDGTFRHLKRSATQAKVRIGTVSQGQSFDMDGVRVEVLWPKLPVDSSGSEANVTSGNNDSVVVRMTYGTVSVIMTGDIEQGAEQSLADSGMNLRADLIKVPHHGSKTSSTEAFLAKVNPKYAVVSVGAHSRFGHPSKEVLDRYTERGVKLYWTGRDGMVTAKTDGAILSITNYVD